MLIGEVAGGSRTDWWLAAAARSGDRQQEVMDIAGGGSSGRWSRWSLAVAPHGHRQQKLGEATTSITRPSLWLWISPNLTAASPRSSPTSPGWRMEDVPFPGIAGPWSAGCRHELNHGGQTAQILARFPPPWVLRGHQEGHRGSVPGGGANPCLGLAVQIHHLASHTAHSQPPCLPHQLDHATIAIWREGGGGGLETVLEVGNEESIGGTGPNSGCVKKKGRIQMFIWDKKLNKSYQLLLQLIPLLGQRPALFSHLYFHLLAYKTEAYNCFTSVRVLKYKKI
jgi:hypothetical protein